MFLTFVFALVFSILFFVLLYILILRAMQAEKRVGWLFLAFMWFALFLPIWAGGLWLRPFGPMVGGVPILGYALVGLAVSLLLGALLPSPQPEPEPDPDQPRLRREEVLEAQRQEDWGQIGWFLGIFFVFMIAAIVARFLF
jgi:hypothetical protein